MSLLVTVGVFVGLELVLAVAGVRSRWYENDPYVGFSGSAPLFVETRDAAGQVVMETAPNKRSLFNLQRFPSDKAPGTYRIFCLGGSTTYGHPYDDATSFCGWLRELLPVVDASRNWELVNAGGISYASYRVAQLEQELIRHRPDLFIIYTGHNEFLEQRTYADIIAQPPAVRGVGALLRRTRTASLAERAVAAARKPRASSAPALLEPEVVTRLDNTVGPSLFTRDDAAREQVLRHFRFNLARMIALARSAGAEAILVTPASNLRGCTPFKSEHSDGLNPESKQRCADLVEQARSAHGAEKWEEALAAVDEALALDGRYAHLSFMRGLVLDRLGRYEEAKLAYVKARDEDVCTLRAPSEIVAIVRDVAAELAAPLVDFEAEAERRAPQGIPGQELFMDHVDPTVEGYRLIALDVIGEMSKLGVLSPAAGRDQEAIDKAVARVEEGLDAGWQALGLMNLSKILVQAGRLKEAYSFARRAVALAPDDVGVHYQAGLCAQLVGRTDEAIAEYRRALEIQPAAALVHGNLGAALERNGELQEAAVHYRSAIEGAQSEKDAARNRKNLAGVLVRLGYAAYGRRSYAEALDHLAEAARLEPDNPDTLNRLGIALSAAGRLDEAVEAFTSALKITPEDAMLHNRLAAALAFSGRLQEASEQYQEAVRLNPDVAAHPESLPSLLLAQGRREDASRVDGKLKAGK